MLEVEWEAVRAGRDSDDRKQTDKQFAIITNSFQKGPVVERPRSTQQKRDDRSWEKYWVMLQYKLEKGSVQGKETDGPTEALGNPAANQKEAIGRMEQDD